MMLTFLRSPNSLHIFDATVETLPMFALSSSLDFMPGYIKVQKGKNSQM